MSIRRQIQNLKGVGKHLKKHIKSITDCQKRISHSKQLPIENFDMTFEVNLLSWFVDQIALSTMKGPSCKHFGRKRSQYA